MVGSDSRVQDIKRYPPFAGLESSQENVRFSYSIGRENKTNSNGSSLITTCSWIFSEGQQFKHHMARALQNEFHNSVYDNPLYYSKYKAAQRFKYFFHNLYAF
mgnify:CR=1 FL=1